MGEQFEAAIFFDNDEMHITAVSQCPGIECIKVASTDDGAGGCPPAFPPAKYRQKLSTAGKVVFDIMSTKANEEMYDPISGMQNGEFTRLSAWIEDTGHIAPRAALFDFDRTLTVMEGFDSNLFLMPGVTYAGYMNYLCGGTTRLLHLRAMFTDLLAAGVTVFVITNNSSCSVPPQHLSRLLGVLCNVHNITLICSRTDVPEDRPVAKLIALFADGRFESLCPQEGGKKTRRKARRVRRTRRKM
jgi:hypothetical protein